jgi:hypothetical protein
LIVLTIVNRDHGINDIPAQPIGGDKRRKVIRATCTLHEDPVRPVNLVVRKLAPSPSVPDYADCIELDPQVTGVCVIRLNEAATTKLFDLLSEWLGRWPASSGDCVLDWRNHTIEEWVDHPIGVLKAECDSPNCLPSLPKPSPQDLGGWKITTGEGESSNGNFQQRERAVRHRNREEVNR